MILACVAGIALLLSPIAYLYWLFNYPLSATTDSTTYPVWAGPNLRVPVTMTKRFDLVKGRSTQAFWRLPSGRTMQMFEPTQSLKQFRDLNQIAADPRGVASAVIVCLDPLVALVVSPPHHNSMGSDASIPSILIAPWTYDMNIVAPYDDGVLYLSPDLHVGLTAPTRLPNGDRVIPTRWGQLRLTKEGDEWRVLAEPAPKQ